MTRVSSHFNLLRPVPFVDVHVERDNRLFVEPSAIRFAAAAGDSYAQAAELRFTTFFDEVLGSARRYDRPRGLDLLGRLHEPNETRLGMTRVGVNGHGVGSGLADNLWQEIRDNPACSRAVLVRRIEDMAPYIQRIGPDLISDLCTRIAFDVLLDFTASMMIQYPDLGRRTSVCPEDVWDSDGLRWATRRERLPTVDGKRLLLVPTNWVWPHQLLNAPSFYQVQALGRLQRLRTQPPRTRGGRPVAPTKYSLRYQYPGVRPTNVRQAVAAIDEGINLTDRHASRVQRRLAGKQKTAEQVNALIQPSSVGLAG